MDPLNYMDNFTSYAALTYMFCETHPDIQLQLIDALFLICVFFIWIRGLTYFRTFGPTRYICKMVAEVV